MENRRGSYNIRHDEVRNRRMRTRYSHFEYSIVLVAGIWSSALPREVREGDCNKRGKADVGDAGRRKRLAIISTAAELAQFRPSRWEVRRRAYFAFPLTESRVSCGPSFSICERRQVSRTVRVWEKWRKCDVILIIRETWWTVARVHFSELRLIEMILVRECYDEVYFGWHYSSVSKNTSFLTFVHSSLYKFRTNVFMKQKYLFPSSFHRRREFSAQRAFLRRKKNRKM